MGKYTTLTGMAKCPYFERVTETSVIGVVCSPISDKTGFDLKCIQVLPKKSELKDFVEIFCADMYESCPHYQAVTAQIK